MRPRTAPAIAAVIVALVLAIAAPPAPAAPTWGRPVDGRVVRPFRAPLTRFGAGHLGVDFAAAPGTPVLAAGAGRVEFAGVVANSRHVVLLHPGALRTSYSFLATIRVHRGQVVARGAVLGTTGGTGDHHDGGVLHFGLRIAETFVDPMQLFAGPDLAARVHLVDGSPDPPGVSPSAGGAALARPLPMPTVAGAAEPSRDRVGAEVAAGGRWAALWRAWAAAARIDRDGGRYTGIASGPIPAASNHSFARP
jgi:hypothetical protein